jgi:hypothetical protein
MTSSHKQPQIKAKATEPAWREHLASQLKRPHAKAKATSSQSKSNRATMAQTHTQKKVTRNRLTVSKWRDSSHELCCLAANHGKIPANQGHNAVFPVNPNSCDFSKGWI